MKLITKKIKKKFYNTTGTTPSTVKYAVLNTLTPRAIKKIQNI